MRGQLLRAAQLSSRMTEERAMCDGSIASLIEMGTTPIGLAVMAGLTVALFMYARWLVKA
jgi:hypothetical protein